jgi:hypothetical protein
MQTSKLVLRTSAGENVADPIEAALTSYVNDLRTKHPKYTYRSGVAKLDLAVLSMAMASKAVQVGGVANLNVKWEIPSRHEVDPNNSKIWHKGDAVALLYEVSVQTPGGTKKQFFSLSYED